MNMNEKCQDEKINYAFRNLHKNLVDEICGFFRVYGIEADDVVLSIDGLKESIKYGEWCPCTDSSLIAYKEEDHNLCNIYLESI